MVIAKRAGESGVTRSSFGQNSRVTALPPGFSAACTLRRKALVRLRVEVVQEIGDQDEIVIRSEIDIEGAAGKGVEAAVKLRL